MDLVVDVISAASTKVRKTKIMYRANLSYSQMEKYIKLALKSGLLERDDSSLYLITAKGKAFQKMYATYLERCKRAREVTAETAKAKARLESLFQQERLLQASSNQE